MGILRTGAIRGAATVAALPLLLFGACGSTQEKPLDLTGRWESEIDESVMTIEETGLFAVEIPGEKLPIVGTVDVAGTQATFRNRPETKLCVGDDGIYEIVILDDRLISREVRDTCPSRVLHMSRPWKRLPSARTR